ncbi:MAG: hypothetical protein U0930_24695 [Pirellulales bacterium]
MRKHYWPCLTLVFLTWSSLTLAQEPHSTATDSANKGADSNFIRITRSDDGKPLALETSITSYSAGENGAQVDLIGAIHIGEKSYYRQLNKLFDQYDVLLYELVAPEGTVISQRNPEQSTNPVSFLQNTMKEFLGLQSQLEKINYDKKHFVRADMTPEQMSQKMAERGDTVMTIALSTFVDAMRQQNKAALKQNNSSAGSLADLDLSELLQDPLKAKVMLAEQFVSSGSLDQALGSSLNQLIVLDRNAEAMKGLQKQIAAGKKKIGIFYGAAHLPDLEKRLVTDFGMKNVNSSWIAAWDLTKSNGKALQPMNLLFRLLK